MSRRTSVIVRPAVVGLLAFGLWGCGGDARVELAAATSIEQIAAGLQVAIDEYHREVGSTDDRREDGVVDAFIGRVRADHADSLVTGRHEAEFREAMRRIRDDRAVEWARYAATTENLATLREVTTGLRKIAVESLALSDEARRYLHGLVDAYRQADAKAKTCEVNDGNCR